MEPLQQLEAKLADVILSGEIKKRLLTGELLPVRAHHLKMHAATAADFYNVFGNADEFWLQLFNNWPIEEFPASLQQAISRQLEYGLMNAQYGHDADDYLGDDLENAETSSFALGARHDLEQVWTRPAESKVLIGPVPDFSCAHCQIGAHCKHIQTLKGDDNFTEKIAYDLVMRDIPFEEHAVRYTPEACFRLLEINNADYREIFASIGISEMFVGPRAFNNKTVRGLTFMEMIGVLDKDYPAVMAGNNQARLLIQSAKQNALS